jgi:peroxiredoxin
MNRMTSRSLAVLIAGAAIGLFAGSTLGQATPSSAAPKQATPTGVQPASKPSVAAPESAKLGEAAPQFTLTDTDGKEHKLADLTAAGKIVVLEWFNPDCPVSAGFHSESSNVMVETAKEFRDQDVVWIAVNSGGPGKQGAGLEHNQKAKADMQINYPILLDESGDVGRAYGAKTTPHMFIIGADGKLAYKGDIVDKADGTNYVAQALTQLIAKETVTKPETKPNGCAVKYAAPKKTN